MAGIIKSFQEEQDRADTRRVERETLASEKVKMSLERTEKRKMRLQKVVMDAVGFFVIVTIGGIAYLLRKPLGKIFTKISSRIEKDLKEATKVLEDDAINIENRLRKIVVQHYFDSDYDLTRSIDMDGTTGHDDSSWRADNPTWLYNAKMGGNLYEQLIVKGAWGTIHTKITEAPPAQMDPTFIIGTGEASFYADSTLIHMTAIEMAILCRALIAGGTDYTELYPPDISAQT